MTIIELNGMRNWLDTLDDEPLLAADRSRFEAAAGFVQDVLGGEWLSRELVKPLSRRHQLAVWWIVGGVIGAWNIRGLAEDLQAVQKARGIGETIERLRNRSEFESTRYEVHCAALVARAGADNLEFAPAVPPGKADFAFDKEGQRIFNECKKLHVSEAERAFLNLFENLRAFIRKAALSLNTGFFEVRVRSNLPPDETPVSSGRKVVGKVLERFRGRFLREVSGPIEARIFPLRARIRPPEQAPDIGPGGSIFTPRPPRFVVGSRPPVVDMWTEFEMSADVHVESPWALYVECARDPREVTRVKNVLKDIARQLPDHAPNLLWIGTTQYQDHESLASQLQQRFARGLNRRLGGVMLTLPTVYRGSRSLDWVDWLQFVEHPSPRVPLPEILYSALGLVTQMKLQSDRVSFPAERYSLRWLYWRGIMA